MEAKIVTRAFNFNAEVKDGNIEGMAAVYGQTVRIGSFFNEVIEEGAFDECDFRDVLLFVNHNIEKITLARSRRNNPNSTMQLDINRNGLHILANVDTENNVEARALVSAIKRGDINGMSIMFRVDAEKWENLESDMPTRRILKIKKVYEVSAVNWPAYDETSISARSTLDSGDFAALEKARAERNKELDSFNLIKRKFKFLKEMKK